MSAVIAMVKKEGIIFLRYPTRILSAIIFPLFLTLIYAFTNYLFTPEAITGFISTNLFVGMAIFLVISIASEAPTRIIEEQQQGTLESIFLTPTVRYSTILGVLTVRFIFMIVTVLFYYWVIQVSFGATSIQHPMEVFSLLLLVVVQAFAFGILMSGYTLTAKETALRASIFIPYIIIIFSGVFVPISQLPTGWDTISRFIPLSYTVDAIYSATNDPVIGNTTIIPILYEVVISIIFSCLFLFVSVRFYLSRVRAASQNGSLLEY